MPTRKILISPGFGAGWSTWIGPDDRAQTEFALFDEKLIAAVERGLTQADLADFEKRFIEAFPDSCPYLGGARDLVVEEVEGQFQVNEYDGYESLWLRDSDDWF